MVSLTPGDPDSVSLSLDGGMSCLWIRELLPLVPRTEQMSTVKGQVSSDSLGSASVPRRAGHPSCLRLGSIAQLCWLPKPVLVSEHLIPDSFPVLPLFLSPRSVTRGWGWTPAVVRTCLSRSSVKAAARARVESRVLSHRRRARAGVCFLVSAAASPAASRFLSPCVPEKPGPCTAVRPQKGLCLGLILSKVMCARLPVHPPLRGGLTAVSGIKHRDAPKCSAQGLADGKTVINLLLLQ